MISNITNALPAMLKRLETNDKGIMPNFDLVEMLNFYASILPKQKSMCRAQAHLPRLRLQAEGQRV